MEFRELLRVFRTRKWTVVRTAVLLAVLALVFSLVQPQEYEGEARILISENDASAAILGPLLPELYSQPERSLQTQVELMRLRPLLENTVRRLGLKRSPAQLLRQVDVSAVGQTDVVSVKATAGDPEEAVAIADTLADEFVAWSRTNKRENLRAAGDEVEDRLEEVRLQALALGRRIQKQGKSDELAAEMRIAADTYSTLSEKLEQLRINEQLEAGSGRVVSRAAPSLAPVSPKPWRNTLLGAVAGMALGLGMALLYEHLDNTLKSGEDVERIYDAPTLGYIPLEGRDGDQDRRLSIVQRPWSRTAESYRILRNALDFVNFERDKKTVVVASAAPGEGKSTVAANMAVALAQANRKVVLVSCDFRRPTTDRFFDIDGTVGLSDVLSGSASVNSVLQRPLEDWLTVMTSGACPPNPSELLGSRKMRELLEHLGESADWIVIDTPPLLAVSDAAAVARHADGILIVCQLGSSTRPDAAKAAELLNNVGAKVLGSVIASRQDERGARHGYGYDHGGYGYHEGYSYLDYSPAAGTGGGEVAAGSAEADGETCAGSPRPWRLPWRRPSR